MEPSALQHFHQATQEWFRHTFAAPSTIQEAGWSHLAQGQHALLLAPTGSGKTLAAFLSAIDRVLHEPVTEARLGPRVLYISPIKALAYDIEKNLRVPLQGITEQAAGPLPEIRIDVRTGDTSASERRRQLRNPGDILITTPESLYLLLGSQAREGLRNVETVILDEIHAIANNKRGVHLMLSMERLDKLCGRDVQRVGLSATQRPLSRIAKFLGGDRKVEIVDCSTAPALDLQIVMPVALEQAGQTAWDWILPKLLELVQANQTTLLFCNSRRLAERLAQQLNELANSELTRAHHGSVARHQRQAIEEDLKQGRLRALCATSSLELGIDMSTVDLVIQVESPGSVSRGLQRVGRAGHSLGQRSHGIIVPKFRADLLEATVVGKGMLDGEVEESQVPRLCLDVLAQQIVAACSVEDWPRDALLAMVRRSFCYADLSQEAFTAVLDMLSGHYPSDELQDLRPRIQWDRQTDTLETRRGSKMISLVNGGTIPDRGLFAVHLGEGGARIGELDEEMVYEARPGETFFLGASTWRILQITRDQVIVAPAPGESGKMPFWRGEGPGRPIALGRRLGAFCAEFSDGDEAAQTQTLCEDYKLDQSAAQQLLAHLREQQQATGRIPSDRDLVIERFSDEVGDWRLCLLSPYGARVHAPWAMAISARLTKEGVARPQIQWTDDGIALRLPDTGRAPELGLLLPSPDEVQELVVDELADSALFATHFRENAARALLLPRQRPGQRTPLWLQRLRSEQLLSVAKKHPSFPIVIETYRECLQDVFDMPALTQVLEDISSGTTVVTSVETQRPSPFARSLVFSYVAAFLYEGDAPVAERKAQVLSLDRALLRELLGTEDLRDFLDLRAIAAVTEELQCTSEDRQARDPEELHDLLRRLGAQTKEALAERCCDTPSAWLQTLCKSGRALEVEYAGKQWFIAAEDAGRYRDVFSLRLPGEIPEAFLAPEPDAMLSLALRYAAKRGPFVAEELAADFGLSVKEAELLLRELETRGRLTRGEMTPGKQGQEWCHGDSLRRIRRRSLELLRGQIAPVTASHYAAFLCRHHGLTAPGHGPPALKEAIEKLAGLPLPWSELESRILPARVSDYRPEMLDALCAAGEVLWLGAGGAGNAQSAKVRLLLRHQAPELVDPADPLPGDAPVLAVQIDEELQHRGASFLTGLALPPQQSEDLLDSLAYLIWHGRLTNDTLAFLRALKSRPRTARAKLRRRTQMQAGRWSSTAGGRGSEPTRVTHTRAQALLLSFGVVSRQLGPTIGNWPDVAKLLRAMEEQGKLRRGHFVEDLQGSQYAFASTITALRETPTPGGQLLAACDPASPWGTTLAWPRGIGARRAGATLLCWQGEPICYLDSGRKRLSTYRRDEILDLVLAELMAKLASSRTLRITHIDGEEAADSPLRERFLAHEFRVEQSALVLECYR